MVDNLITMALGIWATLVGFGKLRLSKNPDANTEYMKKYGTIFRVGGIVMVGISAILIVIRYL